MGKIQQYLQERAKWARFGKPLRGQDEMSAIFNICKDCHMFQKENEDAGSCGVCGCNIKKSGTFLNKIAWATTRCPLSDPKWKESSAEFSPDIEITKTELQAAEQDHKKEEMLEKQPPEQKKGGCGCGK